MKMVAFAFVVTFLFSLNVNAELYHGMPKVIGAAKIKLKKLSTIILYYFSTKMN